jgi:hypothetical protein
MHLSTLTAATCLATTGDFPDAGSIGKKNNSTGFLAARPSGMQLNSPKVTAKLTIPGIMDIDLSLGCLHY